MGYYNSFVIRIWSGDGSRIHGSIEHVRSHECLLFIDLNGIADFIDKHLRPAPPDLVNEPDVSPDEEPDLNYGTPFE
jgi:hypothetical protein